MYSGMNKFMKLLIFFFTFYYTTDSKVREQIKTYNGPLVHPQVEALKAQCKNYKNFIKHKMCILFLLIFALK
jgi:hypothetical protein